MIYLHDTTVFNNLLKALDTGMTVWFKHTDVATEATAYVYYPIDYFVVCDDGIDNIFIGITVYGEETISCRIFPSDNFSRSQLYTPTNIQITEIEPEDPVS